MVGGGIEQPQRDVEGGGYQGGSGLQFRVVKEDSVTFGQTLEGDQRRREDRCLE